MLELFGAFYVIMIVSVFTLIGFGSLIYCIYIKCFSKPNENYVEKVYNCYTPTFPVDQLWSVEEK